MKIDKNTASWTNLTVFSKEQQDELRKSHKIKKENYGEFVFITTKEEEELLGIKYDGTWSYYLRVDYSEFDTTTYKGIVINKNNGDEDIEVVRVCSNNFELDEEFALSLLYKLEGEVTVTYLSSYDDYKTDLETKNK